MAELSFKDNMGFVTWHAIYKNLILYKLLSHRKMTESQTHGLSISTINPKERLYNNFYHFKGPEFQHRIIQSSLLPPNMEILRL